mgnify:CR=1 FL=1
MNSGEVAKACDTLSSGVPALYWLIQKVSPLTEVARYDAATTPHIHMICLKCKSVQDVNEPLPEIRLSPQARNGFKVLSQQVLLQGHCAECLKSHSLEP